MTTLREDGADKVLAGDDHHRGSAARHAGRSRRRVSVRGRCRSIAYAGLDIRTGKNVGGIIDADSPRAARIEAAALGRLSDRLCRDPGRSRGRALRALGRAASSSASAPQDLAVMTRQLSTLVGAGLPLVDCLSALVEQVDCRAAEAHPQPDARARQRGQLARRRAGGASRSVQRALRQHGARRRGERRARRRAPAPRRLHRDDGAAASQGAARRSPIRSSWCSWAERSSSSCSRTSCRR